MVALLFTGQRSPMRLVQWRGVGLGQGPWYQTARQIVGSETQTRGELPILQCRNTAYKERYSEPRQRSNMSESVRAGLPGLFQSQTHADVCIRFHLERTPEEQQRGQQQQEESGVPRQQQQQRHEVGGAEADPAAAPAGLQPCTSAAAPAGLHFVGDPLPAHKILLTLGSTFLKTKLESRCWQDAAAGVGQAAGTGGATGAAVSGEFEGTGGSGGAAKTAITVLPAVLVPVGSEAEVPFAREALKYIYTGSLSADLGFEALLRVRQQACYLGVKYCPQACDQAMLALLTAEQQQQQQQQHETGQSLGFPAVGSCVVQAYACHALFPEPGTSPDAASFQPVRSALAKQLVSHFGDAVAALTRPDLYQQLLQLPAVAVRELLTADDFGTDSEDSVFLMLAAWLDAQTCIWVFAVYGHLSYLVRFHRLSSTYLHHVLPAYKPSDVREMAFFLQYVGAGEHETMRDVGCLTWTPSGGSPPGTAPHRGGRWCRRGAAPWSGASAGRSCSRG